MSKAAMDENVNIISLGDLNKNCMVNLPAIYNNTTSHGISILPTEFLSFQIGFSNPGNTIFSETI
jgi:hypothetical protein